MTAGAEDGEATAAMLAALDAKWDSIERDYGVYNEHEMTALLGGVSADRVRQSRGLLAYERNGRRLYPAWHVKEGQVVDMRPITAPLRTAGWNDEDIIMRLISANAHTEGQTPPAALLVGSTETTGRTRVPDSLLALITNAAQPAW
ncbi:hypothetical protein [Nocardioides abyssi]|uniref:Uncharacterized protein n=1 Tax=Nocardioides abyssi TaxID=3058370 RepID=A0ABT8ESM5_9ACTN|nr:hypothetical protein [Nocardioides abyssi]MDN4161119.1 hypothetical protein [Nocardioides abyssi]